nr:MAG TPA: hypothetical protein [Caudoviricetes sp.]
MRSTSRRRTACTERYTVLQHQVPRPPPDSAYHAGDAAQKPLRLSRHWETGAPFLTTPGSLQRHNRRAI